MGCKWLFHFMGIVIIINEAQGFYNCLWNILQNFDVERLCEIFYFTIFLLIYFEPRGKAGAHWTLVVKCRLKVQMTTAGVHPSSLLWLLSPSWMRICQVGFSFWLSPNLYLAYSSCIREHLSSLTRCCFSHFVNQAVHMEDKFLDAKQRLSKFYLFYFINQ